MDSLIALGFTKLEAAIYVYLVGNSPATGYQIAKAIEKPNSNTYQSLESLTQRGLLMEVKENPRRYRAVPYQEMLDRLDKTHRQRCQAAATELNSLTPAMDDFQTYSLTSVPQAFERCRSMLEGAEYRVLVDAFPTVPESLVDDLRRTADRGVRVNAKVYQATELGKATVVTDGLSHEVLASWQGQWLNLVVDGASQLNAHFDITGQRVIQAIWTMSPYLSFLNHFGLLSEMVIDKFLEETDGTQAAEHLKSVIDRLGYLDHNRLPGFRNPEGFVPDARNNDE